ncbi:DUF4238 domain-containing protein [Enterococcus sp.]|uniref:DUF4238 domain-containing protein n=1 Tax=Enterococcus sp. TaxID=35783 RepID=UPI00290D60DF|nr:DUF4238 domain-containing protein [Enterococcus sp.]MDU5337240.1 DUF4238 domain-containing protein [Enterococcus sp.]
MKINNHYVPKTYLKQWAKGTKIYEYALLVSHERVPKWKEASISRTSSVNSLYIYYDKGEMNDEMEDYFSEEFEMKYTSFINKVNTYLPFDENDNEYVAKLIASQYLRTLSGFHRIQKFIVESFPSTIEEIITDMEKENHETEIFTVKNESKQNSLIPLNLDFYDISQEKAALKVETYAGKSLWIFAMKHMLSSTYKVLNEISWCVYDAPTNFSWVTTDDPVIFLNYYGNEGYDFNGGWGRKNTNIIFPLSPKKLLFAQIGQVPKASYKTATYSFANTIQKYIVEHAFSKIYSEDKNNRITKIRKRTADKKKFNEFYDSVKRFHESYIENEVPYLSKN